MHFQRVVASLYKRTCNIAEIQHVKGCLSELKLHYPFVAPILLFTFMHLNFYDLLLNVQITVCIQKVLYQLLHKVNRFSPCWTSSATSCYGVNLRLLNSIYKWQFTFVGMHIIVSLDKFIYNSPTFNHPSAGERPSMGKVSSKTRIMYFSNSSRMTRF